MYKHIDEWKEFIPEREFLLEYVRITKNKILAVYLVNACSEVVILNYEGMKIGEIPLPQYSSLAGISGSRYEEEFFYGVDSFTFPKILYRYDPVTKSYSEYRKTDNPINPDDYAVKQEWYNSKDGTKIPVFIFHKKTFSPFIKTAPLILEANNCPCSISLTNTIVGSFLATASLAILATKWLYLSF